MLSVSLFKSSFSQSDVVLGSGLISCCSLAVVALAVVALAVVASAQLYRPRYCSVNTARPQFEILL